MENPGPSIDLHHADRDDSTATIFVEGEAAAGQAACLMPRRYRKQPEWWVVELVALDAPTDAPQKFRLSCSADGMWGTEGIEIVGPASAIRIDRAKDATPVEVEAPRMATRLKAARRVTD